MLSKQNSLDIIQEYEPVINPDSELENLDEKMKYISTQIAEEFHILNHIVSQVKSVLNVNFNNKFMNTEFEKQEYVEEYLDSFVHEYQTVKNLLRKGREIKCIIGTKEK